MDPQSTVAADQKEVLSGAAIHRRKFLLFSGGIASAAALVSTTSCKKTPNDEKPTTDAINLGSGDVGILNYAYALEQLEAAFYTKVVASPYSGMAAMEAAYLKDVRDHEVAHREFFKNALGSNAIPSLTVDFSKIDFTSRDTVLATAKAFEDLGVSAYNGAGRLLKSSAYLLLAGKIVSVEARHAALIRDLIMNGSFADSTVIDANGLDVVRKPDEVLPIASAYIVNKIDASNLPK